MANSVARPGSMSPAACSVSGVETVAQIVLPSLDPKTSSDDYSSQQPRPVEHIEGFFECGPREVHPWQRAAMPSQEKMQASANYPVLVTPNPMFEQQVRGWFPPSCFVWTAVTVLLLLQNVRSYRKIIYHQIGDFASVPGCAWVPGSAAVTLDRRPVACCECCFHCVLHVPCLHRKSTDRSHAPQRCPSTAGP